MPRFDRIIIADWSASSAPSPLRPSADAIWLGSIGFDGEHSQYFRTRRAAEAALQTAIALALAGGQRLLIGCDFPMGYPKGFAQRLTGLPQARAVWHWLARQIKDGPDNRNNRFQVAAAINREFGGKGPFWGRPQQLDLPDLPATRAVDYPALRLGPRREVEKRVPRAQPVWKLFTTGAAGSQGLMGQPMLHRLCQTPGVAVWPFDRFDAPVVVAEVYPSLLAAAVRRDPATIKDEAQVRLLARALFHLSQQGKLDQLLDLPAHGDWAEEGWILAAGHGDLLEQGLSCG